MQHMGNAFNALPSLRGCSSGGDLMRRLILGCCASFLVLAYSPIVSADDYLSELDAEAKKVDARQIDGETGTSTVVEPPDESADDSVSRPGVSRDVFEALLRKDYKGTFSFYKKLPERSRQEVLLKYQRGASIREVTRAILERLR